MKYSSKITKAIIPVAGLGTRSLPASKNIPKEMLPIHDKPTVQYIVEEAMHADIKDIIFITNKDKTVIEDHFDYNPQLEALLTKKGKTKLCSIVREIAEYINIISIRQKEQKGLGHAILCAKDIINNEQFAVMLGDDLFFSNPPGIAQLKTIAQKTGKSVIGVMEVSQENISKYGIIDFTPIEKNIFHVHNLVEKPSLSEAPSNYAIVGRYILTPAIFKHLEKVQPGADQEIQLTDALQMLANEEGLLAVAIEGKRFDAGDRIEYLLANIHLGLEDTAISKQLRSRLLDILKE